LQSTWTIEYHECHLGEPLLNRKGQHANQYLKKCSSALVGVILLLCFGSEATWRMRILPHFSMRETQPDFLCRHESVVALKYSAPLATVAYAGCMTACTGIVLTGVHSIYEE
jgi:hypothetical protein